MAGYVRNDGSNNIADGNVIQASDLDGEFDAIVAAFNESTGHQHDGTSAEGAPIEKVGPVQDLVITATEVKPKTDNTLDLGTNTLEFKDLWLDGTANIDSLVADTADINAGTIDGTTIGGSTPAAGTFTTLTATGNVVLGNAATDTVTVTADVASDLIPSADGTYDLGASGSEWQDLFIDGTANIDSLVADTADINGGTIDGVTIGGSSAGAGTFTTLTGSGDMNIDSGTLFVDASENRVGIGTTSPVAPLTVQQTSSSPSIVITTDTTNKPSLRFRDNVPNSANLGEIIGDRGLIFSTNAAERMRIASNGDISFYEDTGTTPKFFWDASAEALGLGTVSPNSLLHLASASPLITFTDTDNSAYAHVSMGSFGGLAFNADVGNTRPSTDIRFSVDNTERMRIDSSGNVGIGTSSPSVRLHTYVNNTNAYNLFQGNAGSWVFGQADGKCQVGGLLGTHSGLTVDTSGNVGIGTSSPSELLDVYSASTNARVQIQTNNSSSVPQIELRNTAAGCQIGMPANVNAMTFTTADTERMRIDSSGNVGIGTSSPASFTNYKYLQVNATTNAYLKLTNATTGSGINDGFDLAISGNDALLINREAGNILFQTNGSERMRIDSSGNVGIGTTSPRGKVEIVGPASETSTLANAVTNAGLLIKPYSSSDWGLAFGSLTGQVQSIQGVDLGGSSSRSIAINALGGDVGIGTASPAGKLQVKTTGTAVNLYVSSDISTSALASRILLGNSVGTARFTFGLLGGGGEVAYLGSEGSFPLYFQTAGTERMRIDSSGNVGIGKSSITAFGSGYTTVAVEGTSGAGFKLSYSGTDVCEFLADNLKTAISAIGARPIIFITNSTERMRIDSSGRVGIGDVPKASFASHSILQVGGQAILGANDALSTTGQTYLTHNIYYDTSGTPQVFNTSSANEGTVYTQIDGTHRWSNSAATTGAPSISERMRLDASGNLLVGTTTAGAGAGFNTRLAVDGGSSVDPSIFKWSGGATSAAPIRAWNAATVGDNYFVDFATETSYTGRGGIDYNRAAGLVRYNTSSDANLKNILGDSDGTKSVEILNSTRIREFAWKEDESQKPQIGVIAQELYETYKGAVSVGGEIEKTDAEGNVTTEYRPWAVDKTAFTFHLVAGWQAHQKIIEELKSEIETLKSEVAALKGA